MRRDSVEEEYCTASCQAHPILTVSASPDLEDINTCQPPVWQHQAPTVLDPQARLVGHNASKPVFCENFQELVFKTPFPGIGVESLADRLVLDEWNLFPSPHAEHVQSANTQRLSARSFRAPAGSSPKPTSGALRAGRPKLLQHSIPTHNRRRQIFKVDILVKWAGVSPSRHF